MEGDVNVKSIVGKGDWEKETDLFFCFEGDRVRLRFFSVLFLGEMIVLWLGKGVGIGQPLYFPRNSWPGRKVRRARGKLFLLWEIS